MMCKLNSLKGGQNRLQCGSHITREKREGFSRSQASMYSLALATVTLASGSEIRLWQSFAFDHWVPSQSSRNPESATWAEVHLNQGNSIPSNNPSLNPTWLNMFHHLHAGHNAHTAQVPYRTFQKSGLPRSQAEAPLDSKNNRQIGKVSEAIKAQ